MPDTQSRNTSDKAVRIRAKTYALLEWLVKHDRRGTWIEEVAVIAEEAVRRRGFDPDSLKPIDGGTS